MGFDLHVLLAPRPGVLVPLTALCLVLLPVHIPARKSCHGQRLASASPLGSHPPLPVSLLHNVFLCCTNNPLVHGEASPCLRLIVCHCARQRKLPPGGGGLPAVLSTLRFPAPRLSLGISQVFEKRLLNRHRTAHWGTVGKKKWFAASSRSALRSDCGKRAPGAIGRLSFCAGGPHPLHPGFAISFLSRLCPPQSNVLCWS